MARHCPLRRGTERRSFEFVVPDAVNEVQQIQAPVSAASAAIERGTVKIEATDVDLEAEIRQLEATRRDLERRNEDLLRECERRCLERERRIREGYEAWEIVVAERENDENEVLASDQAAKRLRRKSA